MIRRPQLLVTTFVALCCSLYANPASAGWQGPGTITNISMDASGVAFISMNGTRAANPACVTQSRWAIAANTLLGQSMLSIAATAYATGKPIGMTGTNNCSLWGDTESIQWLGTPQ
jgi:hypothetical protein